MTWIRKLWLNYRIRRAHKRTVFQPPLPGPRKCVTLAGLLKQDGIRDGFGDIHKNCNLILEVSRQLPPLDKPEDISILLKMIEYINKNECEEV